MAFKRSGVRLPLAPPNNSRTCNRNALATPAGFPFSGNTGERSATHRTVGKVKAGRRADEPVILERRPDLRPPAAALRPRSHRRWSWAGKASLPRLRRHSVREKPHAPERPIAHLRSQHSRHYSGCKRGGLGLTMHREREQFRRRSVDCPGIPERSQNRRHCS